MFLQEMSLLVGMNKFFTSHKGCKLLMPMLVMRKALEGTKGKTIHRL